MRRCLGEFEQKLFSLAERAHRADEQQDCFTSRQRVLQDRNQLRSSASSNSLAPRFNDIDRVRPPLPQGATSQSPWQSLELLDPVVQELSMSLDQLGARGETYVTQRYCMNWAIGWPC